MAKAVIGCPPCPGRRLVAGLLLILLCRAAGAAETGQRWELTLPRAVTVGRGNEAAERDVRLHLGRCGSAFPQAWATVGPRHQVAHPMDSSGLKLAGWRLAGEVATPSGRGRLWNQAFTIRGRFRISAELAGETLAGTFTAQIGEGRTARQVQGKLTGRTLSVAALKAAYDLPPEAIWPCYRGPNGSGSAVDCGQPMVRTMDELRLLWHSEEWVGGSYACPVQCGHAGPIVADNRVFVSFWGPGGELHDKPTVERTLAGMRDVTRAEARKRASVLADDVAVCIDAATGMTLWKQVFPGRALNLHVGPVGNDSKGTSHLVPCYWRGRLYAMGCLGYIDCFDARTGDLLWESYEGLNPRLLQLRQQALAAGKQRDGSTYDTPLNVIGGVLVSPWAGGLMGLDAETGQVLWKAGGRIASGACAIRWVHQGKEYVIADNRCLDPRTGKVLWTAPGGATGACSVSIAGDILVTCGDGRKSTFHAYRMRPDGAEMLWSLDDVKDPRLTARPLVGHRNRSPNTYQGHVYAWIQYPDRQGYGALCADLLTGRITAVDNHGSYRSGCCGGLVQTDGLQIFKGIRILRLSPTKLERMLPDHGANELSIPWACSVTPAVAGGRLFVRTEDGVACYDLRAPAKPSGETGSPGGQEPARRGGTTEGDPQ